MKKFILLFFSIFLMTSSLFAVAIKVTNKDSKLYNEIDQTYDIKKSWWWYEEEVPVKDENGTKEQQIKFKKVKYKVTPAENKQISLLKALIKTNADMVAELKKTNEILEYNFPRRFQKWTTNKKTGKKCLANSSADCYVPILIPEAQQVPAMAKFLKNPNMKNAKNYLQWQATHFNHVMKVGYGLSFAYKQYGKEAYPTSSMLGTGSPSGYASKYRYGAKFAFLQNIQKQLKIYVFVGKTKWMEDRIGLAKIALSGANIMSTFDNFEFVFLSKEDKERLEREIKKEGPSDYERFKHSKSVIDPSLFKKFKIDLTPFVVVTYTDKKGNEIWQKLSFNITQKGILNSIYNFLEYNGVAKPENVDEAVILKLKSYDTGDKMRFDPEGAGMQTEPKDFNIENVNEDQILKKGKKK